MAASGQMSYRRANANRLEGLTTSDTPTRGTIALRSRSRRVRGVGGEREGEGGGGGGKQSDGNVFPILGYYLTFIHYFGFSINPDDDRHSRYLSIRLRRPQQNTQWRRADGHPQARDPQLHLKPPPASVGRPAADARGRLLASYRNRRSQSFSAFVGGRLFVALCKGLKFVAIALTTLLALNHCIVLAKYVYEGSKAFLELMLELRLVITKFSALIFVLSWHHRQARVRQLIKLIRSTSIYILGTELGASKPGEHLMEDSVSPARPTTPSNMSAATASEDSDSSEVDIGAQLRSHARHLDRRIVGWWLMCVCVTMLHFTLSEFELTKSHHLWQWLDDYSLSQLSNQTISRSTLLFLASFDNYIYTVHVYGTRLIGASIICIVCSLQRENIASLRWQSLRLTVPVVGAKPDHSHVSNWLYLLGQSDWFQVEQRTGRLEARGHLSGGLVRLGQMAGQLWGRLHSGEVGACKLGLSERGADSSASTAPTSAFGQLASTIMLKGGCECGPTGPQAARPTPMRSDCGSPTLFVLPTPINGLPATASSDETIECHMERLAAKYELVRKVNARIDDCFGPMLLIQFSFLFLMSCIDVVYFSICFNPNTKTKYIIISGMILLWWPYLLLYKFASDIGCSSEELLISVHRLARLLLMSSSPLGHLDATDDEDDGDYAGAYDDDCEGQDEEEEDDELADCDRKTGSLRGQLYGRANLVHLRSQHPGGWRPANSKQLGGDISTFPFTCLRPLTSGASGLRPRPTNNRLLAGAHLSFLRPMQLRKYPPTRANGYPVAAKTNPGASSSGRRIINKLGYVFKPTYLSIVGVMTVNKFFLLNFAKIVITASVMMIQFISN